MAGRPPEASELCVGPDADADRYVLGEAQGAGSEGVLYRGHLLTPSGTRLPVAVKMLHPQHLERIVEWQRRWTEQVELLRSVQAPGVVPVRDGFIGALPHRPGTASASTARALYLVMNWVEGQRLDHWLTGHFDEPASEKLRLLLSVGAALDLMHSGAATGGVPIVHRDLKPANILVLPDGRSVLVDFGLVRSLPSGRGVSAVSGTMGYIAPETLRAGEYSPATDRYGFGAVAYFLLTGEDLGREPTDEEVRERLGRALPGQTAMVDHVRAMLSADPTERPLPLANWCAQLRASSLTADDELHALPPLAGGRRTSARVPRSEPGPKARERRRGRMPVGAIALVAVTVLGGGVAVLRARDDPSPPTSGAAPSRSVVSSAKVARGSFGRDVAIPPGRYATGQFRPVASLTFGEGWRSLRGEQDDIVDFARTDDPRGDRPVTIVRVDQVLAYDGEGDRPMARPANLVDWLVRHPRLRVISQRPGGVLELEVRAGSGYQIDRIGRGVSLFAVGAPRRFVVLEGNTNRLAVSAVGSDVVVAAVEAPGADYGRSLPLAESLLSTLALGTGR